MGPVLDYVLFEDDWDCQVSLDEPKPLLSRDSGDIEQEWIRQPRGSISASTHRQSVINRCKSVQVKLGELRLSAFYALSDDDVAEPQPDVSLQDSSRPWTPWHQIFHRDAPRITPSSPISYPPSAAAAFEAARIAAKYQLDLIYVVNLWPTRMARFDPDEDFRPFHNSATPPSSSASSSCLSSSSTTDPPQQVYQQAAIDNCREGRGPSVRISAQSGMAGRLLAAHGLHLLKPPFQIAASVHRKILRTDGWIEYREESAAADEFARGYACSFYTGHSPLRQRKYSTDGGDADVESSSSSGPGPAARRTRRAKRRNLNNRGIVFAAYRKPRTDASELGSSQEELAELYADAETLVEMLIDIHVMQRSKSAGTAAASASSSLGGSRGDMMMTPPQSPALSQRPGVPAPGQQSMSRRPSSPSLGRSDALAAMERTADNIAELVLSSVPAFF